MNIERTYRWSPIVRPTLQAGFTLIEVLVALSIVAVALGGMLSATSVQTSAASHMQQKTIAQWVGLNRITELRLATHSNGGKGGSRVTSFAPTASSGVEEMAGVEWQWAYTLISTPDPNVEKIQVTVSVADDSAANEFTVFGYRRRPVSE